MTESAAPWLEAGYADITAAARSGSDIEVEFANGDVVLVAGSLFGVAGDFEAEADADEGLSVRVTHPADAATLVTWTQIRAAADPAFAQHLRREEVAEARRVGLRLRALREDKNLAQRDVAALAGMTAPQLSKIESGDFDVRVSTVRSLLRAMGASFSDIAGPGAPEVSRKAMARSAERAGVPGNVVGPLLAASPRHLTSSLLERAFGWRTEQFLSGQLPAAQILADVVFTPARLTVELSSPMVLLGRTVSEIVRSAVTGCPDFRGLPAAGQEVHGQARDSAGRVTLTSLATWAWQAGIAVVPMAGSGDFCAAVWDEALRPVVVLAESRQPAACWLLDLAHELGHLALGHADRAGLVDVDSPAPRQDARDPAEQAASDFALDIVLPDHRELLDEVRREARGSHLRFKAAVTSVADAARVSPGLLGMVAAYELTEVGQQKDRRGPAASLARPEGNGREQVQAVARQFVSLGDLDPVDEILLRQLVLDKSDAFAGKLASYH